MIRLYLGYALSGFLSLGFQIIWFRLFTAYFGATSLSFLVVLVGFIGGLGVGALVSARVEGLLVRWTRLRSALAIYGAIELLVALSLGLTVGLTRADRAGFDVGYAFDGFLYQPAALFPLAMMAIGLICVGLPAILMGTTFPLLCRIFPDRERFPSGLYAANTFGAATGVLATQLIVLPTLGHTVGLWCLMAANAALGLYFLAVRPYPQRDRPRIEPEESHPSIETVSAPLAPAGPPGAPSLPNRHALVAGVAVAGFLAGAIEGDLVKRLWFLGATTTAALAFISFAAVIAIFLGATIVRRSAGLRPVHLKVALVVGFSYYLGIWKLAYPARAWLENRVSRGTSGVGQELAIRQASVALATDPGYALLMATLFAIVPLTAVAMVLPFVCNTVYTRGRPIGAVYGVNTLAFCAGIFAFAWAAPSVNVFYSLNLMPWIFGLGVTFLLLWRPDRRPSRGLMGASFGACLLAVTFVPTNFDRTLLDPKRQGYHLPARAMKSNGAHTTYVVQAPEGDRLYFDSHPMSGTSRSAQIYMRLMAHVPLLMQEHPRSALVIGFGVGNTAAAVAQHPSIERLDIVELNHRVIETAGEFARTNASVHRDPRVRIFHDDGRRFLSVTERTYDLITAEPPPPVQEGVHRLYSQEYYAAAARKLSAGGVLSQWLPVAQLPGKATARMLATFTAVFRHSLLFVGQGHDLLLFGSNEPLDGGRLVRRYNEPGAVQSDLKRLGISGADHLLSRAIADGETLRQHLAGRKRVSDERNDLAFFNFDGGRSYLIPYQPDSAHQSLANLPPALIRRGDPIATDPDVLPGIVQFRVPSFPFDALDLGSAILTHRWAWSARLRGPYLRALASRQYPRADAIISQALTLGPNQPWWQLEAARRAFRNGDPNGALALIETLRQVLPNVSGIEIAYARALVAAGRPEEALTALDSPPLGAPLGAEALTARGEALVALGRSMQALAAFRDALRVWPHHPRATRALARLLAELRARVN